MVIDRLRRHPRAVLGSLAALVLLTAAILVIGGGETDDLDTVSGPTTTREHAPSTTDRSTTSAPTTTAAASTSVAPSTTEPATTLTTTAPPPPPGPAPLGDIDVTLVPVATLSSPIAMATRPGSGELWVAEQGGRVVALRGGGAAAVVDISADTEAAGEQGLLGLAFAAAGDRVYLSYTNNAGDTRVDELAVTGDGVVDLGSRRTIVAIDQPFANHNGGNIVLAPDGRLWLGLGDGGGAGDPGGRAQNRSEPLGKLLRLEPVSGTYEIYAYGLRNPWRFSFDRATGDLWLADVGQGSWEEINRVPLAQTAGADFAWDRMEGLHPFQGGPLPGDIVPVYEYGHDRGCSVTGGFVYRAGAIPALQGAYLYGDYCEGLVRALRLDGGGVAEDASLGLEVASLASFGEDAAGEVYVLSKSGGVYRIAPG